MPWRYGLQGMADASIVGDAAFRRPPYCPRIIPVASPRLEDEWRSELALTYPQGRYRSGVNRRLQTRNKVIYEGRRQNTEPPSNQCAALLALRQNCLTDSPE
jgi:hypothetical protein